MNDVLLPPSPAKIHFVGVGGIGVSGLARILARRGYIVSGCDMVSSRLAEALSDVGVLVETGHAIGHLDEVDLVVITSAATDNFEVAAAHERGIPVVKRAALLGQLLRPLRTIAVAGTHGKTTTSSLVALLLLGGGLEPTAFIGGEVPGLGGNVRDGEGAWAVVEADEYDASFLHLRPSVAIVTNIEADHLDFYSDLEDVQRSFARFVALLPPHGVLIACADDPGAMAIAHDAPCRVVTYALAARADWTVSGVQLDEKGASFLLHAPNGSTLVTTRLAGRHNVSNSVAALIAAAEAGIDPTLGATLLRDVEGPRRRQEVRGVAPGGAVIVDDYAHHPTEIRATLAALRGRYPGRRLRVAFQPHTYSRTHHFLRETGESFGDADDVAITEIYGAREVRPREEDPLHVTGGDLLAVALAAGAPARLTPRLDDVVTWFQEEDDASVVLITMGAGDIWKAGEEVADGGD